MTRRINGALIRVATAAVLFAMLGLLPTAHAQGGFQITPISLILEPGQRIGSYTLKNRTNRPMVVEASVVPWEQGDPDQPMTEVEEVLATPPVFTVPPQGEQVVRVGLTMPGPRDIEDAYRVRLASLPPEMEPGVTGVAVLTAFLVPMFVEPVQPQRVEPEWQARVNGDGSLTLSASNPGNVHLRLSDVRLTTDADGVHVLATLDGVHYLLAEQSDEWRIDGASGLRSGARVWVHSAHRRIDYAMDVTVQ